MQFDDLDKTVQEAAERFHPVYDEQAWRKMENLLNREMPQSHQRCRTVLCLVLFISVLVLGGTRLLYLQLVDKPVQPIAGMPISLPVRDLQPVKEGAAGKRFAGVAAVARTQENTFGAKTFLPLAGRKMFRQTAQHKEGGNGSSVDAGQKTGLPSTTTPVGNKWNGNSVLPATLTTEAFSVAIQQKLPAMILPAPEQPQSGKHRNPAAGVAKQAFSGSNESAMPKQNKTGNSLSLNVSVGAEASAVRIDDIGSVNPVFGATIGYRINRKWNIRAGFYKVKKVYKADASDYHPPSEFWADYPYLESIEARCTVIEMPFVVDYTFKKSATAAYFGAVGFSSSIMKRESYHYLSERPGQPYQSDTDTYTNQNKQYLSSLRLSFGYEKKINNHISVAAEPYLNLPLRGSGFGKVRLNSGGVLLTLGVKPFGTN